MDAENPDAKEGHNVGVDWAEAAHFVERIENLNDDKASIMGKAKNDCKVVQQDINSVLDEAKEKGITKQSIREKVNERALLRKADAIREKLEGEALADFDYLSNEFDKQGELALEDEDD